MTVFQTPTDWTIQPDRRTRRCLVEDLYRTTQVPRSSSGLPRTIQRPFWENLDIGLSDRVCRWLHCRLHRFALVRHQLDKLYRISARFSQYISTADMGH